MDHDNLNLKKNEHAIEDKKNSYHNLLLLYRTY